MRAAHLPADEKTRVEALQQYAILDTQADTAFDDLTALAAQICGAPMSLISFVDRDRQWVKSRVGLSLSETTRELSFCAHALHHPGVFTVPDALRDERFADNPLVTGEPGIRFYAGAPLIAPTGAVLGTLCVMDRVSRQLTAVQIEALRALSRQVMTQLELRRQARELMERERRLRAIFDTEPECVKLLADDGSLLEMNPAGLRMIEADSFRQVEHHCMYRLVVEAYRQPFKDLTDRVFAGASGTLQFEVTGLKGARRWLETHATPLRDDSGSVTALLGITRDITDRKRAEKELRDSESRFATIFYSSPAALVLARLGDHRIIDVNAAFEAVIGHPRDACLTRTMSDLGILPHEKRDRYLTALRETGALRNLEFRFTNHAGETRLGVGSAEQIPLRGEPHLIVTIIDVTERRRAESSLRESEERLRLALDAAHLGTFDWDVERDRITWTHWHEETGGLRPGEFRGTSRDLAERVHPDDLPAINKEVARCMADREPFDREFRVVWPDGSVHWVLGRGEFVFGHDGRPLRMRGVVLEITRRKAAELRILKLNRVYAMLSGIHETIVRQREPAAILAEACRIAVASGGFHLAWIGMWQPSTQRLTIDAYAGADEETLSILRALIESDPPAGCWFTATALRTGRHATCEDIARDDRAQGWRDLALERRYRSMAAFPLTVDARVIGTFNIYSSDTGVFDAEEVRLLDELATDIGFALGLYERDQERQRAELERGAAEERLRQVVENIQEVFWITDSDKTAVLYVSPAYERVWGRPCQSLYEAPDSWVASIHPEDRHRVIHTALEKQAAGEYDETYRILRPDGSLRWIHERAFPVRGDDGKLLRIVGTAIDITDQRQLEDQFRQAQKMESVGRLAGGIAHDFNNLLTVINGVADLTLSGLNERDPLRADLEEIRRAGDRAAALTRQLLALSRQQILKPQVINLTAIVRDMQSMFGRLIGEDVDVSFLLSEELGNVKADPGQVEQILLNLVVNARDAMPDGGRLTIETRNVEFDATLLADHATVDPGPHVMLAVSDTGVGMDEATRERIFEPFYTTKAPGKGTGLGLSTVYGIVKQSGGTIWVFSEPNHGTTFKIYLPRVDQALQRERPHIAPTTRATETILLVEDEDALRYLARRVLEASGYTVLEASSGNDALLLLERHRGPVHLLLTDVVMPGMNGRELATRLAPLRPEIKVVYTSGYTDDAIVRHGVLDDAAYFIGKPFTPAVLRSKVREILDT